MSCMRYCQFNVKNAQFSWPHSTSNLKMLTLHCVTQILPLKVLIICVFSIYFPLGFTS